MRAVSLARRSRCLQPGASKSRAVEYAKTRNAPRVVLIGLKRAMLSLIDGKGPIRFVLALLAFFRFHSDCSDPSSAGSRWRGVNKQTAMKHLLSFKKELGTLTSAINRRSSKQKKRGGRSRNCSHDWPDRQRGSGYLCNFQGKVMMTVNATDVTDVITINSCWKEPMRCQSNGCGIHVR